MTRAKVCGITSEADRDVAVDAGADAIGLIAGVTVDTPRDISLTEAATLAAGVPPLVSTVLVTMPDDVQTAREYVDIVQPDVLQLHGSNPELFEALSDEPVKLVAAVDPEDPDIDAYATVADALLVDSVDAEGGGGTGETHDWDRTRDIVDAISVPVILAGGLTPENVAEAVETVRPFGVDVASGVEASGGVKDHDAVRSFVQRATRVEVAP